MAEPRSRCVDTTISVYDVGMETVLDELIRREPIFHRPEFGTSRADFDRMMSPDFWEVGASGQCYSREFILDVLERRHASPHDDVWEASDFRCRRLSEDVYLLTYLLTQNHTRRTRRSTLWRRTPEGWTIEYHQGTLIADTV